MRWNVEINILIVIAVQETAKIEGAAHGKKSGELVGMTERNVDCLVSAKAATQGNPLLVPVLVAHQRQHFVGDITFVGHVPGNAPARRHITVVPTLAVNRVQAVKL